MYGLYTQLNDYDQPEYVAMIFSDKPSEEQLLEILSKEYANITKDRIAKLLKGKIIYDTRSGKAEHYCYNTFKLRKVNSGEWL